MLWLSNYQRLIKLDNCDLEFTDGALKAMARLAIERKTGARGLRSIIEDVMRDVMYELPSREDVVKVVINKRNVVNGSEPEYILKEKAS